VEEELYKHYSDFQFRKWKLWTYRSTQQSEANLIARIKEKFGPNPVLAYGSWSEASCMKGLMPSPTKRMSRLLAQHFDLVIVPEYNTTKTCSKCMCEIDMESPFKVKKPCKPTPVPNQINKEDLQRLFKHEIILEDLILKKKSKQLIDVRGLRRCKNVKCAVLFSRDYNAAMNIKKNLEYHIKHKTWHPLFSSVRKKEKGENKEQDKLMEPSKGSLKN